MVVGGNSSEISRVSLTCWGVSVFLQATYKWERSVQKLNEAKVLPQMPVKDLYEPLGSWPMGLIVELKSLHHCETSQRGKQQTENTTQLISQICLILLFKYLSFLNDLLVLAKEKSNQTKTNKQTKSPKTNKRKQS